MAPAISCENCEFKAKTADEPATSKQMERLFNAATSHASEAAMEIKSNIINGILLAINVDSEAEPKPQSSMHQVEIKYYETTPKTGFEKATIV